MSQAMKPSEVDLTGSFPPLVGTFDRTENEMAAFMVVRALAVRGDEWRAIEWQEIASVLRADFEAAKARGKEASDVEKMVRDVITNPFCSPDAYGLVDRGYAAWVGAPGKIMELTPKGIACLEEKWPARPPRGEASK